MIVIDQIPFVAIELNLNTISWNVFCNIFNLTLAVDTLNWMFEILLINYSFKQIWSELSVINWIHFENSFDGWNYWYPKFEFFVICYWMLGFRRFFLSKVRFWVSEIGILEIYSTFMKLKVLVCKIWILSFWVLDVRILVLRDLQLVFLGSFDIQHWNFGHFLLEMEIFGFLVIKFERDLELDWSKIGLFLGFSISKFGIIGQSMLDIEISAVVCSYIC